MGKKGTRGVGSAWVVIAGNYIVADTRGDTGVGRNIRRDLINTPYGETDETPGAQLLALWGREPK